MKQLAKKTGKVLIIVVIIVFLIYFTYTAEMTMDYFNIGADNS